MKKTSAIALKLTLIALLLANINIARADLYVVTNQDNPANSLSLKEVRKVFLGRLHLYPGTEHEPLAIDLPQTSQVYRAFYEKTVGISLPKLKRYRAYYLFSGKGKIPSEAASSEAVLEAIKRSTYAIGYVETSEENLTDVKVLFHQE